ncbi:MAG: endonuclease domain-containing protein [Atopobiaceae bacterium]|jgi:very-short-patch-repair endonuclease|nr:endonuclease domain-containing protein [Atopobiaceae bacterium]
MEAFVDNISALRVLRSPEGLEAIRRATPLLGNEEFASHVPSMEGAEPALEALGIAGGRLHVLVPGKGSRSRVAGVVSHLHSAPLPPGSFLRIDGGLFVAAPERVYLSLATRLNGFERMMLAYELCGTYAVSNRFASGFFERPQLTTVASLHSYLAGLKGERGARDSRASLAHVVGGAASPMETRVALSLCLGRSLGGYGLDGALLNHRLDVPASSRRMAERSFFSCDLYWPEARLDVEYDSREFHGERRRMEADADRREVLKSMGVEVVTLTWAMMASEEKLDWEAREIARLLGRTLREPRYDFAERRRRLRDCIGLP